MNGCWFSAICKDPAGERLWWRLEGLSKKSKSWSVNISSPTTRSLDSCLGAAVVEEVVGGLDGTISDGGGSNEGSSVCPRTVLFEGPARGTSDAFSAAGSTFVRLRPRALNDSSSEVSSWSVSDTVSWASKDRCRFPKLFACVGTSRDGGFTGEPAGGGGYSNTGLERDVLEFLVGSS